MAGIDGKEIICHAKLIYILQLTPIIIILSPNGVQIKVTFLFTRAVLFT